LAGLILPFGVILVAIAVVYDLSGTGPRAEPVDILAELDIEVTAGAAAGYVPDATCAMCHADKAETFGDVGMGKSFYRPSAAKAIEDFDDNHFYHAPSDRHYEMELRGDEYWFRRYKLAKDGVRLAVWEQKVDWIIGSGHHSRVYLYRTEDGALFQLPLAWYSQEHEWQMAPGFEWPRHLGIMREVRHECMFCHNGFPNVAEGSDIDGMPDIFPAELPEGIGCQRCHGPGAEHVRMAAGGADLEEIHAAIVNPSKLPRERLYDICYGCHMQPVVAVPAVRRFGRSAYSFRPGEDLSSFRTEMDINEVDVARSDRFEINHHPYRLEQSTCFIRSEGALGCLTCHNPHRKTPPAERAAHYRSACLSCHETDADGLPLMKMAGSHPTIDADADCTACHMPERRTRDVIHVTMTDHRIVRGSGSVDLVAPVEKKDTEVADVFIPDPDSGLSKDEQVIYKAVAVLRYTAGTAEYAADVLADLLQADDLPDFEPWLELAGSRIKSRKFEAALGALRKAEELAPNHPKIREFTAVAKYGLGDTKAAIAIMDGLLAAHPKLPVQRYQLAMMHRDLGDLETAIRQARAAITDRRNLWIAWRMIGEIEQERGNLNEAEDAFSRALAIEPDDPHSRDGLVAVLEALGKPAEAARYRDAAPQ
jgi:Flp pilus assembly protein TadD